MTKNERIGFVERKLYTLCLELGYRKYTDYPYAGNGDLFKYENPCGISNVLNEHLNQPQLKEREILNSILTPLLNKVEKQDRIIRQLMELLHLEDVHVEEKHEVRRKVAAKKL